MPIPVYDGLRLVLEQLEIGYQNGKRVRIAFTLDGCVIRLPRVPSTSGIGSRDIRDRMIETTKRRFVLANRWCRVRVPPEPRRRPMLLGGIQNDRRNSFGRRVRSRTI